MQTAGDVPVAGGTDSLSTTPAEVAKAQKQLSVLQWALPVVTGALVVISSFAGEQQRGSEVKKGFLSRLTG